MTGMADMMNFPKRWEDFLHDYEFEDARRIYTNGSRLIPSFRVKQMMEHYAPVRHGRWIMGTGENGLQTGHRKCSRCGEIVKYGYSLYGVYNFCNYCGAKMDEEANNER